MSRQFNNHKTTDYVTAVPAASINDLTEYTWMAWIKRLSRTPLDQFDNIITKVAPDGVTGKVFFLLKSALYGAFLLGGSVSSNGETNLGFSIVDAKYLVPLNTWTHVAVTYSDSGDRILHFFVNGAPTTNLDELAVSAAIDADATESLKAGAAGIFHPIGGREYDVRVYNTVLNQAQIAAIVAGGIDTDPAAANDKLHWGFSVDAASEPDLSGNSNTGVFTNTAFSSDSPSFEDAISVGNTGGGGTIAYGFWWW